MCITVWTALCISLSLYPYPACLLCAGGRGRGRGGDWSARQLAVVWVVRTLWRKGDVIQGHLSSRSASIPQELEDHLKCQHTSMCRHKQTQTDTHSQSDREKERETESERSRQREKERCNHQMELGNAIATGITESSCFH